MGAALKAATAAGSTSSGNIAAGATNEETAAAAAAAATATAAVVAGVGTLLMYTSNLLKKPKDPRVRRISTANQVHGQKRANEEREGDPILAAVRRVLKLFIF
jgi:bifunctional ADP-heptose synthase (sugar kinase/adenylyltransferase)